VGIVVDEAAANSATAVVRFEESRVAPPIIDRRAECSLSPLRR